MDTPTGTDPELCRVSIIGGHTQMDLGLPVTVPILEMMAEVTALIESRDPADPTENDDAPIPAEHWTLARIGHPPLNPESTLAGAGIRDGDVLLLQSRGAKAAPAFFDDVIDAVARFTGTTFRGWTVAAVQWAVIIAALVGTPVVAVLLVLAKNHGQGVPAGVIAVGAGLAALTAAVVVARAYALTTVSIVLSLCALILLAPGVALFVPTTFGSAHMLLACAVCLVVATVAYRLTAVGATLVAAAVSVSLFGGVAAAAMLVWHHPPDKVGAAVVAVGLTVVSLSARLAAAAARIPVPPVPTAGGQVDPADHEPRPTIEGIGAIGATALASAAGLAERARVANQYQSGILIGTVAAVVVGAVAAADPLGPQRWPGIALAVVAGVVLCLRVRTFADLTQGATLAAGGGVTLFALMVGLGVGHDGALLSASGALLLMIALTMAVGVGGVAVDPSPLLRRAGELAEYALIIAIVPLVLWTLGLYSMARSV